MTHFFFFSYSLLNFCPQLQQMPGRISNKTFVVSKNSAINKGVGSGGGGGDPASPVVRCDNGKAANKPPVVRKPTARVSYPKPPTQKPAARSPAAAPFTKFDAGGGQSKPAQPFGQRAPPSTGAAASSQPAKVRGPPAAGMARCPLCERDFTADRLPKHEEVCRNVRDREGKRKVFDGRKQRLQCLAEANGCDLLTLKKKVFANFFNFFNTRVSIYKLLRSKLLGRMACKRALHFCHDKLRLYRLLGT